MKNGVEYVSAKTDRALLRRFEPVIRYTRGEQFFPMGVERYVEASSLWMQQPGQEPVCLVPEGSLSLARLCEPVPKSFGAIYYLKFIEPLNIRDLASYVLQEGFRKKDPVDVFRAGRGRLARVGYGSRFIDALFSLTLLARGRVPGDTAASAALTFQRLMEAEENYRYYGRIIRQNGWIVLQYWFFYPFNNWRSGFYGANDHEADWETICIYVYESAEGEYVPEWVAYASHDFFGDDLRRRWDDPELEKFGEHPVIYAGAGSHASYFRAGEYLAEIELPFLSPLVRLVDRWGQFWKRLRHQVLGERDGQVAQENRYSFNLFRIPFVDYARGDGITLGPGGEKEWSDPGLLSPPPDWAIGYRGLWGLYARDPVAGENAPAGPVYYRNGNVRRSWYDPLGWSGLDKVPPPNQALNYARERTRAIKDRRQELALQIQAANKELFDQGIEAAAMQGLPHLSLAYTSHQERIAALKEQVKNLRAEYASAGALLEAMEDYSDQLARGERGPARAHIRRAHNPASDVGLRMSRIAEAWSAISIGIFLLSFVGIVLFARQYLFWGLVAVVAFVSFAEAFFRRSLPQLISILSIALAVFASLILVYEFYLAIIVAAVLLAGAYIMWENLKELRT